MSLSPSTPEIKIKELTFLEIEEISLAKYTQKRKLPLPYVSYASTPQHPLLSKLLASEVVSFASDSNGTLQAFSYLLFKNIYGDSVDQQLLKMVKLNLYKDQTNLALIQGHPLGDLKCEEMKKFIVEFIFQLCFSDFNVQLQKKLQKHPVIITITQLFLRCLLAQLGLEQAKNYRNKLPFQTVVQLLGDYLDLNYRKKESAYMFLQSNMFICDNDEQILVGRYGDHSVQPLPRYSNHTDMPTSKGSTSGKKRDRTSWNFGRKDSNYSSNDSHLSVEAPTPCFNTEKSSLETNSLHEHGFAVAQTKKTASTEANLKSTNSRSIFQPEHIQNHYHISSPSVASIEEKLIALETPTHSDCGNNLLSAAQGNRFRAASEEKELNFIGSNRSSDKASSYDFATQGEQCHCKGATRLKLSINSHMISIVIKANAPTKQTNLKTIPLPTLTFNQDNKRQLFLQTERKKLFFGSSISNNFKRTVIKTQESEQTGSPNPSIYSQADYMPFPSQKINSLLNKTLTETESYSFYESKSHRTTSMLATNFGQALSFKQNIPKIKFFYKRE